MSQTFETTTGRRITRRAGLRSRLRRLTWRHGALGLIALIVLYLTLVPLAMILYGTLTDGPPGTDANFTLQNYVRAYGSSDIFRAAFNSVSFAVLSGIISLVIGCYLAWVTERTNTPFKGVIYISVLVPFLVPGILTTISWVFLLSPNIGLINKVAQSLFGLESPPFNIYSFAGMVWTFGIDHITLPFLLMAPMKARLMPVVAIACYWVGIAFSLGTFVTLPGPLMNVSILARVLFWVAWGVLFTVYLLRSRRVNVTYRHRVWADGPAPAAPTGRSSRPPRASAKAGVRRPPSRRRPSSR